MATQFGRFIILFDKDIAHNYMDCIDYTHIYNTDFYSPFDEFIKPNKFSRHDRAWYEEYASDIDLLDRLSDDEGDLFKAEYHKAIMNDYLRDTKDYDVKYWGCYNPELFTHIYEMGIYKSFCEEELNAYLKHFRMVTTSILYEKKIRCLSEKQEKSLSLDDCYRICKKIIGNSYHSVFDYKGYYRRRGSIITIIREMLLRKIHKINGFKHSW